MSLNQEKKNQENVVYLLGTVLTAPRLNTKCNLVRVIHKVVKMRHN